MSDCAAGRYSFVLFNLPAVLNDLAQGSGPFLRALYPGCTLTEPQLTMLRNLVKEGATARQVACSLSLLNL